MVKRHGFDEPWNSPGLAIVGAWNLSSRLFHTFPTIFSHIVRRIREYNRVRRYFRYLPFIRGNRVWFVLVFRIYTTRYFLLVEKRKKYLYALYFFFFKEKAEIDISGWRRYSRLLAEVQRRKGGGRRGRKTRYILFEFPCNKKKVYTAKFPHPRPFLRIHRIRIESLRGKEKQIKKKLNFNDLYFLL